MFADQPQGREYPPKKKKNQIRSEKASAPRQCNVFQADFVSESAGALSIPRRIFSTSNSPCHRLTTSVATPFPTTFVSARHSLMNFSIPTSRASDCTGIEGTAAKIAASVTNPVPVTPDPPFDATSANNNIPLTCLNERCVLVACARNSAASVR